MRPPESFVCPDCGGTARILVEIPESDDVEPGIVVAYRCPDCLERFDVVMEDSDE